MKKVLFIDRDGTLINEAPPTFQIDSFEKLRFYPGVFQYLSRIVMDFVNLKVYKCIVLDNII